MQRELLPGIRTLVKGSSRKEPVLNSCRNSRPTTLSLARNRIDPDRNPRPDNDFLVQRPVRSEPGRRDTTPSRRAEIAGCFWGFSRQPCRIEENLNFNSCQESAFPCRTAQATCQQRDPKGHSLLIPARRQPASTKVRCKSSPAWSRPLAPVQFS